MDEGKKELIGSPSRDLFKRLHKDINPSFYACDIDFVLVAKMPFRIIAFLDYKRWGDKVRFSEIIAYNALLKIAPVFIIQGNDLKTGPFYIYQYNGGNPKPEPPIYELEEIQKCQTWKEFSEWEENLRNSR